ncbi:pyridoxamine 5'-phosphate oxidase family protein [Marinoscillum sp.]|uniref:pyridoxamine 5'-phosphate oxidase family protein n=1 Tax=Marinoscillum sp. TaxID=2024838 RepID=UPI003BA961EA
MSNAINQEARKVIKTSRLCFVATVNPDQTPNLSPKASLQVWDEHHLVFINIASPQTVDNLMMRPALCINAVDMFKRRGYRFYGKAKLLGTDTPEYAAISETFWTKHGANYPIHQVVKVKVEQIDEIHSPAYEYDEQITEANLSKMFHKIYQQNNENT